MLHTQKFSLSSLQCEYKLLYVITGILRIAITENTDTHQKDLQARRGMKTETLLETHIRSLGIIFHITKKRKISGTFDTELIGMVGETPQRPVQQPRYPGTITTNILRPQMRTRTFLMEELRNTLRRKIENTFLKQALQKESPVILILEETERLKMGKSKKLLNHLRNHLLNHLRKTVLPLLIQIKTMLF